MTRAFLDVLQRPFVLSQRPLLLEKQFMDEAGRRGLRLFTETQLADLQKLGLIVPLVRFDKPVRRLRAEARRAEEWRRWGILGDRAPTRAAELLEGLSAGRVSLPRLQPFRPWRFRQRTEGEVRFVTREYLYSPYQLLLVWTVREALEWKLARRAGTPHLEWADSVAARAREASVENDRHVALLTALEPFYYPEIAAQTLLPAGYGSFDDFYAVIRGFDPVEL